MLTKEQIQNIKPACFSWFPPNSTSIPSNSQSSTVNKDIKIGETYNLRIQVLGKSEDFITARPIPPNGEYATTGLLEILHKYAPSFSPLPPEQETSLSRRSSVGAETEVPTPKHDPTRLFRKGDKVRVVKCKGRNYTGLTTGEIGIVDRDESPGTASVEVEFADENMWEIDPAYLELVTPVEELERYVVEPGDIAWFVVDKKHESGELNVVMYMNTHPNPKSAAEAECARLNEEWRKKQK